MTKASSAANSLSAQKLPWQAPPPAGARDLSAPGESAHSSIVVASLWADVVGGKWMDGHVGEHAGE